MVLYLFSRGSPIWDVDATWTTTNYVRGTRYVTYLSHDLTHFDDCSILIPFKKNARSSPYGT